jgi:AcrR family transcriptional regulator
MSAPAGTSQRQVDSARQRILETAMRLFYSEGVRATGIDRIIAESSVAKMSFYRHFPSKSDLVCAFLDERHRRWMAWFDEAVARHARKRRSKVAAVADALAEWFADPGFRGCAFINTSAELTDHRSREHAIVEAHKADLSARLAALARADGLRSAEEFGRLALLIVDGAIVRAQMSEGVAAASQARSLIKALAASYRPGAIASEEKAS